MQHATSSQPMRRAWRNVAVLTVAQAVLGAQMPMIFIVGGLTGQMISPDPCLATLPLSMIILGNALTTRPLSAFMGRHGRRAGFILGNLAGALGAIIACFAIWIHSFPVLVLGSLFTGVYMASQGYLRFAATDTAPEAFRPRAISYVLAGGLAAALIGQALVRVTAEAMAIPFLATYAAVAIMNLLGPLVYMWLDIPRLPVRAHSDGARTPIMKLLGQRSIALAVICGTISYALMNLVMTSTPLAIVGCGFTTGDAAGVVSAHVLAMYVPSFFAGALISRFGVRRIIAVGLVLLATAGVIGLTGVNLGQFYGTLIMLGMGWNFGFIGATALLTSSTPPEDRARVQGINDMVVFSGVFLASLSSGWLMNCHSGASAQSGWSAVNMAVFPLILVALAALIVMSLPRKRPGV
ncbi:MFS transporter [Paracoccus pacificus]|uniref:MFS transporter n=1 Tax=Paracoccus pacificus TaxID=1463598 RepID=A0ABW4R5X0_9RHOB